MTHEKQERVTCLDCLGRGRKKDGSGGTFACPRCGGKGSEPPEKQERIQGQGGATPTPAQLRVLKAVEVCDPADGWGEVFTHYDKANGTPSSLEMRNFDASGDACVRRGWLRIDSGVELTDEGRAALRKAGREP